jgi:hypothetical protein
MDEGIDIMELQADFALKTDNMITLYKEKPFIWPEECDTISEFEMRWRFLKDVKIFIRDGMATIKASEFKGLTNYEEYDAYSNMFNIEWNNEIKLKESNA